jgi:hypothetical protein
MVGRGSAELFLPSSVTTGSSGLFFTAKSLRNDSGEGQVVDGDTRRGHAAQPSRGHGDVGQLYVTGLDFARG